ncbi:lipopolysaccharide transport periplasmic protein LptA [Rhodanobacter aciditrophus]|uniref:lipopolysaccharide transport periplasmic protein LptA n=1 Tax=Rhodanobacter aciditrophus TaxID=1623218 RepID=UPI003CF88687
MSTPRSRRAGASRKSAAGLLAVAALALLPALALAKKSDRQQPMNVEHADSFDGTYAPNSTVKLRGHVTITQGTMKITGDLATVHFDADQNVDHVQVTGAPAHIQELDDSGNLMTGDAAQLDYDNVNGIAMLTGKAVVKQQGRGEAHGDKLTYNTQTSEMTGSSSGDNAVHMTFLPKPKKEQPAPAAPAPSASAGGR